MVHHLSALDYSRLTPNQIRAALEPSFDSREIALGVLCSYDPGVDRRLPSKKRTKPCSNCAVATGLYTGIAGCCYRHLYKDERRQLAERWTCHNGGRCEGAWEALVGEEND